MISRASDGQSAPAEGSDERKEDQDSAKAQIAARIDAAVQAAGKVPAIAAKAELPEQTLRNYMAARSEPKAAALAAISRATGRTIEWLATGEEPPPPVDKDELVNVVSYILELKGFNVGDPLSPESLARLIAHLYVRTLESRAAGQTLSANEALARVRDWAESSTDSDFDS